MKAKIIQASKKFMTRRPCQKFRDSLKTKGAVVCAAVGAEPTPTPFAASFGCSPAIFTAEEPQISQVLHQKYHFRWKDQKHLNAKHDHFFSFLKKVYLNQR